MSDLGQLGPLVILSMSLKWSVHFNFCNHNPSTDSRKALISSCFVAKFPLYNLNNSTVKLRWAIWGLSWPSCYFIHELALDARPTGDWEIAGLTPAGLATFFHGEWSWNIFYGHSLPSAESRRAVVSFWQRNAHNTQYWLTAYED